MELPPTNNDDPPPISSDDTGRNPKVGKKSSRESVRRVSMSRLHYLLSSDRDNPVADATPAEIRLCNRLMSESHWL